MASTIWSTSELWFALVDSIGPISQWPKDIRRFLWILFSFINILKYFKFYMSIKNHFVSDFYKLIKVTRISTGTTLQYERTHNI